MYKPIHIHQQKQQNWKKPVSWILEDHLSNEVPMNLWSNQPNFTENIYNSGEWRQGEQKKNKKQVLQ